MGAGAGIGVDVITCAHADVHSRGTEEGIDTVMDRHVDVGIDIVTHGGITSDRIDMG